LKLRELLTYRKNIVMFQRVLHKKETEMSEIAPLNTQFYKLAATGAGLIVCQMRSKHSFRALLSNRQPIVGMGLGITGGGFVENGDIFKMKPGSIVETVIEAWRETREENLGFDNVFTADELVERAQPIASMHIRIDDVNGVHGTNFYALSVTDEEWDSIASLPPGPERHGPLFEVWVDFNDKVIRRLEPEVGLTLRLDDGKVCEGGFYHKHELRALGMIAWHIQEGYLWSPRPNA
jgi:hypothetical protein